MRLSTFCGLRRDQEQKGPLKNSKPEAEYLYLNMSRPIYTSDKNQFKISLDCPAKKNDKNGSNSEKTAAQANRSFLFTKKEER